MWEKIKEVRERWDVVRERSGGSLIYADAIADITFLLSCIDELEAAEHQLEVAWRAAGGEAADALVARAEAAESRVARLEGVVEAVRAPYVNDAGATQCRVCDHVRGAHLPTCALAAYRRTLTPPTEEVVSSCEDCGCDVTVAADDDPGMTVLCDNCWHARRTPPTEEEASKPDPSLTYVYDERSVTGEKDRPDAWGNYHDRVHKEVGRGRPVRTPTKKIKNVEKN